MFCPHCGANIADGSAFCSACGATLTAAQPTVTPDPAPVNEEAAKKKKVLSEPSNKSKSFAAMITALLVFPATLSVAIDLSFDRAQWCGYVVGAVLVIWVCMVLPSLKITPAPITALICFASIIGYVFYIMHKIGRVDWLYEAFLPMFVLTTALIAGAIGLISSGTVKGLHILSLLSAEAVIFLVALEATWDNRLFGTIDLGWSLIVSCAFVSVIAVFEAFSYINRINKK